MANDTLDSWFYPQFDNLKSSSAILASRASVQHSHGRKYLRFFIPRRLLEEQSGVKMEPGKIYELTGQVGDAFDFHTFRLGTTSLTLILHVPKKHQSAIMPHQLYTIKFSSVNEARLNPDLEQLVRRANIGFNWWRLARMLSPPILESTGPFHGPVSLVGKVYHVKGEMTRYRFDFWLTTFEPKIGFHFEIGRTYIIRGTIVGICGFKVEHQQTESNQHVLIEVPEGWRGQFRHGETYKINIDTIVKKEMILTETEARLGAIWDWALVAAWIDTEGCFEANASRSTYRVSIYQKEKEPLVGICAFLRANGIECSVVSTKSPNPRDSSKLLHGFALVTWGADGLAKVIRNTEPYIRTQNKRNQIARCKEEIARPRKRLEEKVIRARLLLGMPPEGKPAVAAPRERIFQGDVQ